MQDRAVTFVGRVGLAAALLVVVLAWQDQAGAQERGILRIAYLRLGWSATEIIQQEKLLEKRGWKVEWTVVDPISALINSFAAGHVDVIDMSTVLAGRMWEQGQRVVIFGVTTGPTTFVVVPADSPVREMRDLKGRKLGAIPGSSAFQEINAYARRLFDLDLTKDVGLVTAMTPPDLAMLLRKGDVDAGIVWHPTSDALLFGGKFRVLADQDGLWRQSTGRSTTPVQVLYLTRPEFARTHPQALQAINDAQREAVAVWRDQPDVAARAIAAVTGLPREVVDFAMRNTRRMLYGLGEEAIDTIMEQLRIARLNGTILQSEVWTAPDKARQVREELFYPAR